MYEYPFLFQYVVLKFLKQETNYYDIGLHQWIFDLDKNTKEGKTYWPPDASKVQRYLQRKQPAEELTWKVFDVKIKRFKGNNILRG